MKIDTAAGAGASVLAVMLAGFLPTEAAAQLSVGVQAATAQKTGFGIGPRATLELGALDAGFRLSGDLLLFFPGDATRQNVIDDLRALGQAFDGDVDYWEANLNVHVPVGLPIVPLKPYVGGGLNISNTKIQDPAQGSLDIDSTDSGFNVLAGAKLNFPILSPFLEFRYSFGNGAGVTARGLNGGSQWLVIGGIVF